MNALELHCLEVISRMPGPLVDSDAEDVVASIDARALEIDPLAAADRVDAGADCRLPRP